MTRRLPLILRSFKNITTPIVDLYHPNNLELRKGNTQGINDFLYSVKEERILKRHLY